MRKLILYMALLPSLALAQTYPSPMIQNLTARGNAAIAGDVTVGSLTVNGSNTVCPVIPGLVAGGSTDNATAVIAALSSLGTTGGCLSFPAGIYKISSQASYTFPNQRASIQIQGAGPGATTLFFPNASAGFQFIYPAPTSGWNSDGTTIRDLAMTTGQAGASTAISFTVSGSLAGSPTMGQNLIQNVLFQGSDGPYATNYWGTAFSDNGVSQINFRDITVNGLGSHDNFGVGFDLHGTSTNIPIAFNFSGVTLTTVGTGILYGAYVQGVNVESGSFVGGYYGIFSPAGLPENQQVQLIVQNSSFECFSSDIASITPLVNVQVSNNSFFVRGTAMFAVELNTIGFTITGNTFEAVSSGAAGAIKIVSTGGRGGVMTGNTIGGFDSGLGGGFGIALMSGTSGVNVQSNQYFFNGLNVSNAGTGNTIGGGSE